MTSTGASSSTPAGMPGTVDLKLEVVTLPVSDADRAKSFYQSLGWRLDADIARGDAFRAIQFTPPHSACSIAFGKGPDHWGARLRATPAAGRSRY